MSDTSVKTAVLTVATPFTELSITPVVKSFPPSITAPTEAHEGSNTKPRIARSE